MNHILEDIKKFRELLNKTPEQLNEMFFFDKDKKGGQTVPPQDKLGVRPAQGVAKHGEDYKDMMTNPDMDHVKKAYAAGGPKGKLPEDVAEENLEEIHQHAINIITPLYNKVQGLVPAFKDPIQTHLIQAQRSLLKAIETAETVNEENLNEADNKQEFVSEFTTIRNNAIAMSKGQKTQINVPNKVRNDLWNFLKWMESTYGNTYANQVWDHFDLGELRRASAKYEMANAPAPTEEYIDDVTSTFGVLIKYVQKMKDPSSAQPTQ